jgi:hypothetical protein
MPDASGRYGFENGRDLVLIAFMMAFHVPPFRWEAARADRTGPPTPGTLHVRWLQFAITPCIPRLPSSVPNFLPISV